MTEKLKIELWIIYIWGIFVIFAGFMIGNFLGWWPMFFWFFIGLNTIFHSAFAILHKWMESIYFPKTCDDVLIYHTFTKDKLFTCDCGWIRKENVLF